MEKKEETKKKHNTILTGTVISTKADKTISVSVERIFQHEVYKKIIRNRKKYLAHDENNTCKLGDIVSIRLVRPISKRKKWLVINKTETVGVDEVIK